MKTMHEPIPLHRVGPQLAECEASVLVPTPTVDKLPPPYTTIDVGFYCALLFALVLGVVAIVLDSRLRQALSMNEAYAKDLATAEATAQKRFKDLLRRDDELSQVRSRLKSETERTATWRLVAANLVGRLEDPPLKPEE